MSDRTASLDDLLLGLSFTETRTERGEVFGLHRLSTISGCIELIRLQAGASYTDHYHTGCDAVFHMLRGHGRIRLDGVAHDFAPGDRFQVPRNCTHGFEAHTDVVFLSIQSHQILDPETGSLDLEYPLDEDGDAAR